jgi:hypothetical protein
MEKGMVVDLGKQLELIAFYVSLPANLVLYAQQVFLVQPIFQLNLDGLLS